MWRVAIFALIACKKPVAEPTPASAAAPTDARADAAVAGAVPADAPAAGPLIGRVVKIEVVPPHAILTVLLGRDHGVAQGWGGCVLDASEACIDDTSFIVVRAGATESHVRSKLPAAVITQAGRVKLQPK